MKQKEKSSSPWRKWWRNKWLRGSTITLVVFFVLFLLAPIWNPVIFPPISHPRIGVSFSEKRSMEMGLDWRDNYLALLDDMNIRSYRLMSYWDVHEKERGNFNFTSLDWQMDMAAQKGAKVSLAIGLRQPRWPECHQPEWANSLSGGEWKQALYEYITVVVKRYENHPALESWQLENEAVNNWFGLCKNVDAERVNEEFDLVKKITKKPVYMSLSDQHGLPVNPPVPDKYGYSVYRTVWSDKTWPYVGYLTYPTPIWYHRLRAVVIKQTTGRDIFIHELQLEPWGPKDTMLLSIEEQDKSMSQDQISRSLYFARQVGTEDIYLWGSEWWYWRKVNGDSTIWNKVNQEISALR